MRDLSRRACPDHPCDQCAVCRSGRCCQNDSPAPSQTTIDATASALFNAMRHSNTEATSADRTHTVVWVVPEERELEPGRPSGDGPKQPTADEVIRERKRRTRERWAAEERHTPTDVHHHHHVHVDQPDAGVGDVRHRDASASRDDRDVVDAEVIEDDESGEPELPPGSTKALPPGSARHNFTIRNKKGVRRDK